jgi:hypothetical protein
MSEPTLAELRKNAVAAFAVLAAIVAGAALVTVLL